MKINMKEELRKVVIKEYVACDGKVFATEQGCLDHEASLKDILKVKYDAIPRRESYAVDLALPYFDSCDKVHIIKVRDAQDIEIINAWVDRWEDNPNRRTLIEKDIGRTILLVYEDYRGYENSDFCEVIFYEEDILRDVQRALDYINGVGI